MLRFAAALLAAIAMTSFPAPSSASNCAADSELDYICGLERPEDLLAIPGTGWLVASGFAPGAGLKLVDTSTRSFRRWYTATDDQLDWDRQRYPACPGPLDPAQFNARGLSLRQLGPETWQLLAVNHGGRESIEVFEVTTGAGAPRLVWKGCRELPEGQVGNSVTSFSDGTILVTVLTRPGTTIGDFMLGKITGGVWQWRAGEAGFSLLPGTQLPGNNGIEVDPDNRHFYVVSFGLHAVAIFDRADTAQPVAIIPAPDFMPDNIHWTDGRLLLAGMRLDEPACGGLRKVVNGVADPMLCHRGWVVGELDLANHRISTYAYGKPQAGFNGHSVAARANGDLWLGSFQSNRLAIVRKEGEHGQ